MPRPNSGLDAYLENQSLFDQAFQDLTNKNSQRAIEGFQKVLEQNPNHVQSYGNLGLAYAQREFVSILGGQELGGAK